MWCKAISLAVDESGPYTRHEDASARTGDPASGKTFRIFLVPDSPEPGLTVKLEGAVVPDPTTGQVTATFDRNPQPSSSSLGLRFEGGVRSKTLGLTPGQARWRSVRLGRCEQRARGEAG